MEKLVKGDIVVLPFPFSDLSDSKNRPALVLATLEGEDIILCQITSEQSRADKYSVHLDNSDLLSGNFDFSSMARPNRLFTASNSIIKYKLGALKKDKMNDVTEAVCKILIN